MSTNSDIAYSPEERVVLFFQNLKKDLGVTSTQKIVNVVGQMLYQLRFGLSVRQTLLFLYPFPDLFKLLFANDAAGKESYPHLDELADLIYAEDRKSKNSLFRTEIDALKAVVIILKKLDSGLNLFSSKILKYPLVSEVRQIQLEEVI